MLPKFLNSKLFTVMMSSAVSILILILSQSLFLKHEKEVNIDEALSCRPTFEYVDKQDEQLRKTLIQHVEESNKTNETLMDYIKSMDRKIDILINKQR